MYFYNLETKATGVIGQVTEGTAGIYTMHIVQGTAAQLFSGTLNPAYLHSNQHDAGPEGTREHGTGGVHIHRPGPRWRVGHGYGYRRCGERHWLSLIRKRP
jgi:hypothetical protein